ncbi:MAG TPA: hypothetical protein VE439_09855 [Anaerolineae bacterium]|jgi:hypothetical protein|nr:hypothetical protein [Anaerolineae bacterium]
MRAFYKLLISLAIALLLVVVVIVGVTGIAKKPSKAVGGSSTTSELKRDPAEVAAKATPPANPLKATGGPFKSKAEILDKARKAEVTGTNNKLSGREEALLMTEGEFRDRQGVLTKSPAKNLEVDAGREIWIVVLGGEFEQTWLPNPGDTPYAPTKWEMLEYDAATGELLGVSSGPGDWPDAFFKDLPKN